MRKISSLTNQSDLFDLSLNTKKWYPLHKNTRKIYLEFNRGKLCFSFLTEISLGFPRKLNVNYIPVP